MPASVQRITSQPSGLNAVLAGVYVDCRGVAPLPTDGAYVDACESVVRYVVGHDIATVFRPLHRVRVGDLVSDGPTRLRVVDTRDRVPADGFPSIPPGVIEQLQTCDDDGPDHTLIVDLGPVPPPATAAPTATPSGLDIVPPHF